jgi:predicted tellurium resistance membrane protein TerC
MEQLLTADIFSPANLIALLTLTSLEIVLGIDNIVFIAILCAKLKPEQQDKARFIGLLFAMLMRIALLLSLTWIMKLTTPLFSVIGQEISGRDIILIIGGLFLIGKATLEIHHKIEDKNGDPLTKVSHASFRNVLMQIIALDIIFSLDSVITAVGMAQELWVMIVAVVISVIVMLVFAKSISTFIETHPTLKMLALSFLILIGVVLFADGLGKHIDKGYIYFAMAFSLAVEALNIKLGARGAKSTA